MPVEEVPAVAFSQKYLDMRIPLWGVLTSAGAVAYLLISMFFTTGQTAKDVSELQVTVKAGNQQVTTLAGEQALLRFRMENIEGEMRTMRALTGGAQAPVPQPGARRP